MSVGRYNIPKKYRIEKGMPLVALSQKIDNEMCKEIFETEIESITWCYQLVDEELITGNVADLIRQKGISVFEISMKHKISTELMTEMMTSLIPKRSIIIFVCDQEMAMATFIPSENGYAAKLCATDYYAYNFENMIEILNYEYDSNKTMEQVHRRILAMIRQQKRIVMVEKAFESMKKANPPKQEKSDISFDEDMIAQIREDAEYVQEQLHVVVS